MPGYDESPDDEGVCMEVEGHQCSGINYQGHYVTNGSLVCRKMAVDLSTQLTPRSIEQNHKITDYFSFSGGHRPVTLPLPLTATHFK